MKIKLVKILQELAESNLKLIPNIKGKYSQLSLSRLRLSRITAYLEEKIWSLL